MVSLLTDYDLQVLSTEALYCTVVEAGFGLCAICLPTLSGALRLKGFQNFINNFSFIFSSCSGRSGLSFPSHHATEPRRIGSPTCSDHERRIRGITNRSDDSFQMRPAKDFVANGIQVRRDFELRAETV